MLCCALLLKLSAVLGACAAPTKSWHRQRLPQRTDTGLEGPSHRQPHGAQKRAEASGNGSSTLTQSGHRRASAVATTVTDCGSRPEKWNRQTEGMVHVIFAFYFTILVQYFV